MIQTMTTEPVTIADNLLVSRVLADRTDLSETQVSELATAERELRAAAQHRRHIEARTQTTQRRIDVLTREMVTADGADQAALRRERSSLQDDAQFAHDDRQAAVERQVRAEITFIGLALTAIASRNRAADLAAVDQEIGQLMGALAPMIWQGMDRCYAAMRQAVDAYEFRQTLPGAGEDESAISVLRSHLQDQLRPLGITFRLRTDHRTGEASIPWGAVVSAAEQAVPQLVQAELERTA